MREIPVINSANIKDVRAKQNRADVVRIYKGDARHNLSNPGYDQYSKDIIVKMTNATYTGSEGQARLYNEMEDLQKKINAAQNPAQADIEALVGKMFIDITRKSQEAGDLTSLFAREISMPDASETINMTHIYDYVGKMGVVSGSNDSVNLIEQKLGEADTMSLEISALGWKDTLANMLYNKIHNMDKVTTAAVNADTDKRNSAIIGTIVGATFVASQKQAASTTSGATLDVKMYETFRDGIKKLRNLKDIRTNRKIAVPSISILCNSANTWDIQRVIGGQLTTAGTNGVLTSQNMQSLPISNIVEYDQGITNGLTYGKETLSFPGVTAGKCYLYVPSQYLWVVNKRPLTLETGVGSVLQLSTEERAWYRVMGSYFKEFLGSSYPGTTIGAGYGAILEVSLPS